MNYGTAHHKCDVSPRQSHPRCKAATVSLWSYQLLVLCPGETVASLISVFVVKSQMAASSFLSLLDFDLQRKMKEVEKPQRDVGKEERGKIRIPLKKTCTFIISITSQESTINYKISCANVGAVVDQFSYWPTMPLHISLLKLSPLPRKHLFGLQSLNIFKTCVQHYSVKYWI